MKLYLGSQSPRRRELLSSLVYDFEVVKIDCKEIYPQNLSADKVAGYLSELKANSFRNLDENEILITSDTVVAIDQKILGKPIDETEAKEMLKLLSGRIHQVYTAVSMKTNRNIITQTDVADVECSEITKEEIDYYIKSFCPLDKAGAYGIQEWLGMAKIKKINGNFYTIMGFPTEIVYNLLKSINFLPKSK